MSKSNDLATWIQKEIKDFMKTAENTLQNETNEKAFDEPLVGFSSGADPLYETYKDHVGPFHMTPWEIFVLTFSDFTVKPEELTVISYILPQTEAYQKG